MYSQKIFYKSACQCNIAIMADSGSYFEVGLYYLPGSFVGAYSRLSLFSEWIFITYVLNEPKSLW